MKDSLGNPVPDANVTAKTISTTCESYGLGGLSGGIGATDSNGQTMISWLPGPAEINLDVTSQEDSISQTVTIPESGDECLVIDIILQKDSSIDTNPDASRCDSSESDGTRSNGTSRGNYIIYAQTVYDTSTCLYWQRNSQGGCFSGFTWDEANSYCNDIQVEGGGWRLPTREELQSLFVNSSPPVIDTTVFQGSCTTNHWSGTSASQGKMWAVHLNTGESVEGNTGPSSKVNVKCVR